MDIRRGLVLRNKDTHVPVLVGEYKDEGHTLSWTYTGDDAKIPNSRHLGPYKSCDQWYSIEQILSEIGKGYLDVIHPDKDNLIYNWIPQHHLVSLYYERHSI
jgi:hypothetical protein